MPVYKKKDGRIFAVYYDGAKRIWEAFGRGEDAGRAAEARDLEVKLLKKRGQWYRTDSSMTYMELFQVYINERQTELSARTIDDMGRIAAIYARPVIGNKSISMINLDDWRRMQSIMIARNVKNRSINQYFSFLSQPLTWAVDETDGLLDVHPWRKRKRLKFEKYEIELFTLEEFQAIRSHALPHLAWAMEVAYYTGARPGEDELFHLRWDRVNWETGGIHIYSSKTKHWRWQYPEKPFMRRLKDKEKVTKLKYPDCPLICNYRGRRIRSLKVSWKRAKKAAGIERRMRFYDIRHFYITYALASGADIMELAERVGHVNAEMIIKVYAHLAKDLKGRAALKVPSLYDKGEEE